MENINRHINNGETLGGILSNAKIPFKWPDINNIKLRSGDEIKFNTETGNLKLNGKIVYKYKRKIIKRNTSIKLNRLSRKNLFEQSESNEAIIRTFDSFEKLKVNLLKGFLPDVRKKNGKLIPIIYRYKKSKFFKKKIEKYKKMGYKNTTLKKHKKRYSIYSDKNGFKRVVPGTYGRKKNLAIHGSALDNESTMSGGAISNSYAYTLLSDINYNGKNRNYIIENFNPIRGEGALGTIKKFNNAGIKYKLNQETIAVELALPSEGKRNMGITKRQINTVVKPTKGQYVVLKSLYEHLKNKFGQNLYVIPSDTTIFNSYGKIIDGAHGDTIDVTKIGGDSMSDIQKYINEKYRTKKLTQNAIKYFENQYDRDVLT